MSPQNFFTKGQWEETPEGTKWVMPRVIQFDPDAPKTECTISWKYAREHRYDSNLNEHVREFLDEFLPRLSCESAGEAGGTSFLGEQYPSDQSHYIRVPNIEVAEYLRSEIEAILKLYDTGYRADLTWPLDMDTL